MKIDEIAKQLANKINQEHYIKHYLEKVYMNAYNDGFKDAEAKQLILSSVSIELPLDTDLNKYKIDLKTPLDDFYYYHRPTMKDEQPAFRKSLQKALNYIKGN